MTQITRGTGNVLADLGIENAEELSTKVRLAVEIVRIVRARKLRQAEVARVLGIPQPKVSALVNYRLDGFSAERLMHFLTALDCDVEIRIKKNAPLPRGGQDPRSRVTRVPKPDLPALEDLPAFIIIVDKGNDFFQELNLG
jgi:predicted XRE-type DNA-binding protein